MISTSCKGTAVTCPDTSPILITINNKTPELIQTHLRKRGFIFVLLKPSNGEVEHVINIDAHGQDTEFEKTLKDIPQPRVLLGVVKEDGFTRLDNKSIQYLEVS